MEKMVKLFKKFSGKHNLYTTFFDFVAVAAITISNVVDLEQRDVREAEYMGIIGKYSKDEVNLFASLIAELINELEREVYDVLGKLYMALDISSKDLAQFFTPDNVAELMATLGTIDDEDKETIVLGDPACGSGSMIIGQIKVLEKRGVNYQKKLRVQCGDIDRNVLMMCYVQLSLLGIDAVCERRNALTNEGGERWLTPFHVFNGGK